jgi:hypothetical protein
MIRFESIAERKAVREVIRRANMQQGQTVWGDPQNQIGCRDGAGTSLGVRHGLHNGWRHARAMAAI